MGKALRKYGGLCVQGLASGIDHGSDGVNFLPRPDSLEKELDVAECAAVPRCQITQTLVFSALKQEGFYGITNAGGLYVCDGVAIDPALDNDVVLVSNDLRKSQPSELVLLDGQAQSDLIAVEA